MAARIVAEFRKNRSRDNATKFKEIVEEAALKVGIDVEASAFARKFLTRSPTTSTEGEERILRQICLDGTALWQDLADNWNYVDEEIKRRLRGTKNTSIGEDADEDQRPKWLMLTSFEEPSASRDDTHEVSLASKIAGSRRRIVQIPPDSESQADLFAISGRYYILRYLFSTDEFVVSGMRIEEPYDNATPAEFSTKGGETEKEREFSAVEGLAFLLDGGRGELMTVGRSKKTLNVRTAILSPCRKPEPRTSLGESSRFLSLHNMDLRGLRLSTGSHLTTQVAYRVWCCKLIDDVETQYDPTYLQTFTRDDFKKTFEPIIDGFQVVFDWIIEKETLSTEPYKVARKR
ncbi:hypothetical protein [Roseobacter fucihabitans]|uniref:hypothetical protein n=1 Tax=Roseobacter fucihabitans TaxID=1537242 RepID=UPI00165305DC|nr:hypothetical protein [Roseobacter litoralis]